MRTLFYLGDPAWTGSARAFVAAARGLAAREHPVSIACCGNSPVEQRALDAGLDVVRIDPASFFGSDAWGFRKVLQEKFVEVALVHTDREQLVVSTALRLAERGAVIRRVPAFAPVGMQRSGRLALRAAAAGLLFGTEEELRSHDIAALPIPGSVAPLGVDPATYDAIRPSPRASIGVRATARLVVIVYDSSARGRLLAALRAIAILVPRHPEVHVAVIGEGSLDDELRLHAAAVGVNQIVSFLGERDDALEIMRSADVGWIAAASDNAAFAFLDFMAMRIPIVAERSALSQHYIVDQIAGVLLSPGNPSQTASALAAFVGNEERRTAMGNAGRARVQREFPETAMIEGFERAADAASDRGRWAVR